MTAQPGGERRILLAPQEGFAAAEGAPAIFTNRYANRANCLHRVFLNFLHWPILKFVALQKSHDPLGGPGSCGESPEPSARPKRSFIEVGFSR